MEDNDSHTNAATPNLDTGEWPFPSVAPSTLERSQSSSSNESTTTQVYGHGQIDMSEEEKAAEKKLKRRASHAVNQDIGIPVLSTGYIKGEHDLANWNPNAMYVGGKRPARDPTLLLPSNEHSTMFETFSDSTSNTGLAGHTAYQTSYSTQHTQGSISTTPLLGTASHELTSPSSSLAARTAQARLRNGVNNIFMPGPPQFVAKPQKNEPVTHNHFPNGDWRNFFKSGTAQETSAEDFEYPWIEVSPTSTAHAPVISDRAVLPVAMPLPVGLGNPFMSRQQDQSYIMAPVHAASQQHTTTQAHTTFDIAPGATAEHAANTDRQLVHFNAPADRSAEDNVATIMAGRWNLPNEPSPPRGRRGFFSVLGRSFSRRSQRGHGRNASTTARVPQNIVPASVLAQRERDARYLASIGRQVTVPVWFASVLYQRLTPALDNLLNDMPFITPLAGHDPPDYGVVRIRDPYYHITKAEILNMLGKSAQVKQQPVGTPYFAVHIMMDRNTGKTQDVFVEVSCHEEAVTITTGFARRVAEGRRVTLGSRVPHVELSSMAEMMTAIFPYAKFIDWHGSVPVVNYFPHEYYPGVLAASFDGFVGQDEAALMVKWLTEPSRSPFVSRGPNRIYENVITLLHKYPVNASNLVTLKDRKRVYDVALAAVKSLSTILTEEDVRPETRLDMRLLQELVIAALSFPLFTDAQKATMVEELRNVGQLGLVYNHGMQVALGGTHEHASRMPFLVLIRLPGSADHFFKYYCKLIREQSSKTVVGLLRSELQALLAARAGQHADEPFLSWRVDYGVPEHQLGDMSLAECSFREFRALAALLAKAIGRGE